MSSDDMREIRARIKERREFLGLSYQNLAELTKMSKSTLQRYETGDIGNLPLDKLKILAAALECSPAYILGWDSSEYGSDGRNIPKALEAAAARGLAHSANTIFERIDAVRVYRGLSRRQLAVAAKVSPQEFEAIMVYQRDFSVKMLSAIARALGVDIDWLVYGKSSLFVSTVSPSSKDPFWEDLCRIAKDLTPENKARLLDMANLLMTAQKSENSQIQEVKA